MLGLFKSKEYKVNKVLMHLLLDRKYDEFRVLINAKRCKKFKYLNIFVRTSHEKVHDLLNYILENYLISPYSINESFLTALYYGVTEILDVLKNHPLFDPSWDGNSHLENAIDENNIEIIKFLLNHSKLVLSKDTFLYKKAELLTK